MAKSTCSRRLTLVLLWRLSIYLEVRSLELIRCWFQTLTISLPNACLMWLSTLLSEKSSHNLWHVTLNWCSNYWKFRMSYWTSKCMNVLLISCRIREWSNYQLAKRWSAMKLSEPASSAWNSRTWSCYNFIKRKKPVKCPSSKTYWRRQLNNKTGCKHRSANCVKCSTTLGTFCSLVLSPV